MFGSKFKNLEREISLVQGREENLCCTQEHLSISQYACRP